MGADGGGGGGDGARWPRRGGLRGRELRRLRFLFGRAVARLRILSLVFGRRQHLLRCLDAARRLAKHPIAALTHTHVHTPPRRPALQSSSPRATPPPKAPVDGASPPAQLCLSPIDVRCILAPCAIFEPDADAGDTGLAGVADAIQIIVNPDTANDKGAVREQADIGDMDRVRGLRRASQQAAACSGGCHSCVGGISGACLGANLEPIGQRGGLVDVQPGNREL